VVFGIQLHKELNPSWDLDQVEDVSDNDSSYMLAWIMKFKIDDKQSNYVCSVNSFQMRGTDYVFGPHFDDQVLEMRKQAISE
jgi:hypothetical protein